MEKILIKKMEKIKMKMKNLFFKEEKIEQKLRLLKTEVYSAKK